MIACTPPVRPRHWDALGVRDGDQGHHLELAHQGWKIRQIKAAMDRRYCLAPVSREYGKMEEVSMEMNDVKCICVARYPV
jgi:hypothetical protein